MRRDVLTDNPLPVRADRSYVMMMPRKPAPPHDNPEQSRRFIEIAREVGAEGEAPDFDKVLGKVAEKPPSPTEKGKPRSGRRKG